jgi:hypothetical protein
MTETINSQNDGKPAETERPKAKAKGVTLAEIMKERTRLCLDSRQQGRREDRIVEERNGRASLPNRKVTQCRRRSAALGHRGRLLCFFKAS